MMDKITVQQAKRYVKTMLDTGDSVRAVLKTATRMLPELFGDLRPADVIRADVAEVLTVIKAVHFVMQEIVLPTFSILSTEAPVEREASVFDEYDAENGYDELDEINVWEACLENIEAVTQAAIRIMHQSYTDTMNEELVPLLEHLRWEIDHQPERKGG
ncbi:MAG: hypothetical protein II207_07585 [Clostridia bacterium]|nr:hypothetical protein [Clostridia bacterium]